MPINREILSQDERSIVLVGLMGAGKTSIGKRLSVQLGLPFFDADQEIERAAGMTIAEIFRVHGEAYFRAGEKRVIERLLNSGRIVLAPGGGAFLDPDTREVIRDRAISIWLRCPLPVLLQRVQGRTHRPLLNNGNLAETLGNLSSERSPIYAQADIIIDGSQDPPAVTTGNVINVLKDYKMPKKVRVELSQTSYNVLIGPNLISRAGSLLAPILARPRCIVITDETVAALHLAKLEQSLEDTKIAHQTLVVPPGESSKSTPMWQHLVEALLEQKVDRQTTIIALGGGVIGDLAGFVAATTLRGLPFVQIPTTVLSQVDSSVGGKTGINSKHGKNLIGAFHQPILVLADITALHTLPDRHRINGYAEIIKSALIGDEDFYHWCEAHAGEMLNGDDSSMTQAIERSVRFKASIVGEDEREVAPTGGRALLNFGHTFAHALEAETGFSDTLLHGEAVATGVILATDLSARLGFCSEADVARVAAHIAKTGLPTRIPNLLAERLLLHMKQDKKMRGGKLTFVLTRGFGKAFTFSDATEEAVRTTLLAHGAI